MTRHKKKFIKFAMSCGYTRNAAAGLSSTISDGLTYDLLTNHVALQCMVKRMIAFMEMEKEGRT